jgi:prepilin-type N-terminal cleavage/methylation domain-containing protein
MLSSKRRTDAGFTLLEVIVAITLTAGLAALMLAGFRLALNALHRGQQAIDIITEELAGLDAMQHQIGSAVPRGIDAIEGERVSRYLVFRGTAQGVRFLTHSSWAGDRSSALWLASYQVVGRSDGQQQLVLNETGVSDTRHIFEALLADAAPAARSVALGETADRIELSYWQPALGTVPPSWVSEWRATEQKQLPSAMQVRWWHGKNARTHAFLIPVTEEPK